MEGISEELENVGVFFMGGTPSVPSDCSFSWEGRPPCCPIFLLVYGARID
jgi:hypothetical protein